MWPICGMFASCLSSRFNRGWCAISLLLVDISMRSIRRCYAPVCCADSRDSVVSVYHRVCPCYICMNSEYSGEPNPGCVCQAYDCYCAGPSDDTCETPPSPPVQCNNAFTSFAECVRCCRANTTFDACRMSPVCWGDELSIKGRFNQDSEYARSLLV